MTAIQQYLIDLIHAWAAGQTAPVPFPVGVTAGAVQDRLCAHNIEAALGSLLPAASQSESFAQRVNLSRGRTDFLLLELERLLPVIAADNGQPVLLKGAALALGAYREPTDRWFLDLDVLVPQAEVDAVCARLETAGYRHLQGKRDPLFYEKYHLHRIMLGPQGAVIEIHWALTIPGSVYKHDVAGVFDRALSCRVGRQTVPCAAAVDQIFHAVYQNIADGFVDLRRILDLVRLAPGLGLADWNYLVAESRRTGMARGLYLTLHNMKYISGVSIPEGVLSALDPGVMTRRTFRGLRLVGGCLDRQAGGTDGTTQLLHILLTPTARLRAREILRFLWVGEAMLLDRGHRPDQMPGFRPKFLIWLRQVKTLVFFSWRALRALVSG